jgi:hypothetical protein
LIIQLFETHALIDSLKFENTMLFNTIDTVENKLKESEDLLKKFFSDDFKNMLCIHTNYSNKSDIIVDDLGTSTSHASDSKLDSLFIKHVIVDTTCLDNSKNSCENNYVMPKSKDSGTQTHGKFVHTCHNCGKSGHIRPNYFLLKTHRSWIMQDAQRKGKVEESISYKYVPQHRKHMKGKESVICKNANLKSAETVKKHSNKRSMSICHHYGITGHPTQMSTAPGSQYKGPEGAANKSYIRHFTFGGGTLAVCSGQPKV